MRLQEAIETALETGGTDVAAVQHLFVPGICIARHARRWISDRSNGTNGPLPVMNEYDLLLTAGAQQ